MDVKDIIMTAWMFYLSDGKGIQSIRGQQNNAII